MLEIHRSVERQNVAGARRCERWGDNVVVAAVGVSNRLDASTDDDADDHVDLAKARPRASVPLASTARRRDPLVHKARSGSARRRGA